MNAHMRQVNATFAAMFDPTAKQEASEGIVAEPYMGNVCKEDQPDPTSWELGTPDPLAQLGDDAE